MGYKLIILNMVNRRHHDYYTYNGSHNALVGRAFAEAWVNRVKAFDNMALHEEKTTYDSAADMSYYATFNNGELGVSCGGGTVIKFGTKKSSDGYYDYTGLNITFSDFVSAIGSNYTPHGVKCRFIVDDNNNLVASSILLSREYRGAGYARDGFMFTNGGILGLDDTKIYSMGALPDVIGNMYSDMDQLLLMPGGDMEAYRSDMLYLDADGNFGIMDHVQYIMSAQLYRNNSGAWERIVVDGITYVHIGCDMKNIIQNVTFYKNDMWIPIDSVEEEDIEVVIHGDS